MVLTRFAGLMALILTRAVLKRTVLMLRLLPTGKNYLSRRRRRRNERRRDFKPGGKMSGPVKTYRSAVSGYNEFSLWKNDKDRLSVSYQRSKRTKEGTWEKEKIWFDMTEVAHFLTIANELMYDANQLANVRDAQPAAAQQPLPESRSDDDIPY
jgi:hypothetical protein